MNDDTFQRSLELHRRTHGKIGTQLRVKLESRDDLALAYSPGVARPCEVIANDPAQSFELTCRGNTIAVLTDGSAVLGLGDIGATAAMPVMEGKAALFKHFAGVDAVPLCVDVASSQQLIELARHIAPSFAGINLEDIAAPRCFVVEDSLQDLGIPVFHDDQHGTAIVLLAALENGAKVVGKRIDDMNIVINGAGAAGSAIARILQCAGHDPETSRCFAAGEVLVCDSKGIVSPERADLNPFKRDLLAYTNSYQRSGTLREALEGADAFIGVSKANLLTADDIRTMAPDSIVLAMANPIPEIMPDEAKAGGAAIVGTGRSDFPNQVNNVLCFPGIFRGALDARAPKITAEMKLAAVRALASAVAQPTPDQILPDPLDLSVARIVAAAVAEAAISKV
ncbi:MAG: NADP-dependent malic enzyme [Planctomycetes bacterium]|nr:NADP-dependent malic enzyme [Planctomycetota bacterium]